MSDADDATMPDSRGDRVSSVGLRSAELGNRYEVGELLGRGGMGEVRLAIDKRINREVAVKLMRGTSFDDAMLARFFREARVQGVLDHPAVVPVHDLGIDVHGNPYFVMKKLSGTTLSDVLASTDPVVRERWSRRTLLARLVDICFAIEFAHERDVIHRDVKPANIMLGDYGEAYILDWGLARVVGERRIEGDVAPSGDRLDAAGSNDETRAGDLLGTPGYMAPEQARGESVDGRTDTFALGCVLYEVLVGKAALPRGLVGIQTTLDLVELRPSTQSADVPLELDELCARATAADRAKRPSARALAEGIQNYLDGDRDLVRRKELAETVARTAREALEASRAEGGTDEQRANAVREAGRALALDPANATAANVLGYLLIDSQGEIPAEAFAAADKERAESRQQVLKWAIAAYAGFTAVAVGTLFAPLHHVWPVLATIVVLLAIVVSLQRMSRRLLPMRSPHFLVFMALNSLALFGAGLALGPLFLLPLIIIGGIGQFTALPQRYPSWLIPVAFWLPIVVLVVLELTAVLPSTFEFREGSFTVRTWVFDLTPTVAALLLIGILVVQTVNSYVTAIYMRRTQEAAQNRIHGQTWHLRRLLPKSSQEDTSRVPKP